MKEHEKGKFIEGRAEEDRAQAWGNKREGFSSWICGVRSQWEKRVRPPRGRKGGEPHDEISKGIWRAEARSRARLRTFATTTGVGRAGVSRE